MVPQELLLGFSDTDRQIITEEAMADPKFADRLTETLSSPGGMDKVALCARRAVANEFDPRLFPESRGMWPRLRKLAVEMAKALPDIAEKEIDKLPFETKVALVKEVAAGRNPIGMGFFGLADLGQFEVIGSLISSLVGAGASIYNARLTSSTQKSIANIQAGAEMATLQAQIKIADAQKAVAEAQVQIETTQSPIGALSKPVIGGIPLWALLVPAFLLVVGGTYFMARRK